MARLSYVDPETISDPQIRKWLDEAVAAGRPGPEIFRHFIATEHKRFGEAIRIANLKPE